MNHISIKKFQSDAFLNLQLPQNVINYINKKTQQKTRPSQDVQSGNSEIKSPVKLIPSVIIPLGIEELHNNVVKFIQMSKREAVERDSKNEYQIQMIRLAEKSESELNYSSSMSSYNATSSGNNVKRRSASNKKRMMEVGLKKSPPEGSYSNNISKFLEEGVNVYQYNAEEDFLS